MKIKSFPYQTSLSVLSLLALGLAHTAQAQTFAQRITYTPTGGVNFYDTIEAFTTGDSADAFAKPGLSNFDDPAPSSWRGTVRDRRVVIASGIAPGSATPDPLSFDLTFEGAQRPVVVDLVVWDGGPKNGTIVDSFRVTTDGLGGYESVPLPEGRISWAGVPSKFVKRANISIPALGKGTPYSSAITVKHLTFKISKVTVELRGLTHGRPSDLEFLLVGPGGQKVLLLAEAGGAAPCSNVKLTLDDSGAQSVTAPLVSGMFKPTQIGTRGTFPAPAPGAPYSSTLSAFNGTAPNGVWSLYVFDDLADSSGNLKFGWTLTIQ